MTEQEHIGSVAMGDSGAPPCWWIDHGSHGQITQREDEATAAIDEGKKVVRYFSDGPVQEPVCTVSVIGAGGHRWLTPHPLHALDALPVGTPLYAAPQPAHGTSATERAPEDRVRGIGVTANGTPIHPGNFLPPPAPNAVTAGQGVEADRLRRMVERRDEFIIANGLWAEFNKVSRNED